LVKVEKSMDIDGLRGLEGCEDDCREECEGQCGSQCVQACSQIHIASFAAPWDFAVRERLACWRRSDNSGGCCASDKGSIARGPISSPKIYVLIT
jgi:hypothetical protein